MGVVTATTMTLAVTVLVSYAFAHFDYPKGVAEGDL